MILLVTGKIRATTDYWIVSSFLVLLVFHSHLQDKHLLNVYPVKLHFCMLSHLFSDQGRGETNYCSRSIKIVKETVACCHGNPRLPLRPCLWDTAYTLSYVTMHRAGALPTGYVSYTVPSADGQCDIVWSVGCKDRFDLCQAFLRCGLWILDMRLVEVLIKNRVLLFSLTFKLYKSRRLRNLNF